MSSRKAEKDQARADRARLEEKARRDEQARRLRNRVGIVVVAAVVALAGVYALSTAGGGGAKKVAGKAGQFPYQVGKPGPGQAAPPLRLATTAGTTFDLAAQRGKTVLLYFQEGLGCQPCWDQISDLERQMPKFTALGIDKVVSITSDPLDALRQKASDQGIRVPVASDPDLTVSKTYGANRYGMMGTSRDGHSFVVVGPDGQIRFRADYGGAPNYTMYVPPSNLLADIRKNLGA